MTPVPKVVVVEAWPLQTDDVKLQTSMCAAQLSSSLGGLDDDATSRDDVEKFSSSSGGRDEAAPPRAHIL